MGASEFSCTMVLVILEMVYLLQIAVDAELVANELLPVDKPKMSGSVQQTRRSKVQPK